MDVPNIKSKRAHKTHVVHPQETSIQSSALIFFKELQVRIIDVIGCECLPHFEHDIDVPWPFPNDTGNVSCTELLCLTPLDELGVLDSRDSGQENR